MQFRSGSHARIVAQGDAWIPIPLRFSPSGFAHDSRCHRLCFWRSLALWTIDQVVPRETLSHHAP